MTEENSKTEIIYIVETRLEQHNTEESQSLEKISGEETLEVETEETLETTIDLIEI